LLDEVKSIITPLVARRQYARVRLADGIGSMRTDRTKVKQCLLNVLSKWQQVHPERQAHGRSRTSAKRSSDGADNDLGYRDRHERGTTRAAVPGLQPGRCLDTQEYSAARLGLAITRHFCGCSAGRQCREQVGVGSTSRWSSRSGSEPEQSTAPVETVPEPPRAGSVDVAGDVPVLVVDDDAAARDL